VDIVHATSSSDFGVLALGLVLAGLVAGLASGILGIGGGIVVVPVLYHVMATLGVDESIRMHVAVGTSLAAMIPAALYRSYNANDFADGPLARNWCAPMLAGVIAGSALAAIASSRALAVVFAAAAVPIAAWLALGREKWRLSARMPEGVGGAAVPAFVGAASAMTGMGGTTAVPAMTVCGVPLERAVATASLFGIFIAVPGTLGAVIAGWHLPALPPHSLGYVNLFGVALVAPALLAGEPAGAGLAHLIDTKRLNLVVAALIVITTGRMLWDALA